MRGLRARTSKYVISIEINFAHYRWIMIGRNFIVKSAEIFSEFYGALSGKILFKMFHMLFKLVWYKFCPVYKSDQKVV